MAQPFAKAPMVFGPAATRLIVTRPATAVAEPAWNVAATNAKFAVTGLAVIKETAKFVKMATALKQNLRICDKFMLKIGEELFTLNMNGTLQQEIWLIS
jgi:hypothetical protein